MLTAQRMLEGDKRPARPPLPNQPPLQVRARQGLSCNTPRWLQHSPALTPEPGNTDCHSQAPSLLPVSPCWVHEIGTLWNHKGHAGLHHTLSQHGNPGKHLSTAISESRHLCLSWAHSYLSWALALQGWRVLYRESGQGPQGTDKDGTLFFPCIQVNPLCILICVHHNHSS